MRQFNNLREQKRQCHRVISLISVIIFVIIVIAAHDAAPNMTQGVDLLEMLCRLIIRIHLLGCVKNLNMPTTEVIHSITVGVECVCGELLIKGSLVHETKLMGVIWIGLRGFLTLFVRIQELVHLGWVILPRLLVLVVVLLG